MTLTRRSGACRSDQRAPRGPSTSPANAPGRLNRSGFKATSRLGLNHQKNAARIHGPVQSNRLRLWSSCNSRCGGCPSPGQSLRSSSRCPPSPRRCEQPDLCGCTGPMRAGVSKTQPPASHVTEAGTRGHLFRGQILHSSSHLEGTGHQVLDGHVLHWDLVWVVAVLHSRRAPRSEVFPQVALGRVLDYDVKRTWRQKTTSEKFQSRRPRPADQRVQRLLDKYAARNANFY